MLPGLDALPLSRDFLKLFRRAMGNGGAAKARQSLGCEVQVGQCVLAKSGANLVLTRYNGRYLMINGVWETIPAAGVTLAPTALGVGTTFYIYAYMSAGVMTLEASATAHAADTTTGVEVKSGDSSRTLVGMARTIAGPAWQDAAAQRFVRSWFNDPGIGGLNSLTSNATTANTAYVELNSAVRQEFLLWANEIALTSISGENGNSTASATSYSAIGFDGTTAERGSVSFGFVNGVANNGNTYSSMLPKTGLAEGYHYAAILGRVSAGTGTWFGGAGTDTCAITVYVKK